MVDLKKGFGMIFGGIILYMVVQQSVLIMDTASMSNLEVFLWVTVLPLLVTLAVVGGFFGGKKFFGGSKD